MSFARSKLDAIGIIHRRLSEAENLLKNIESGVRYNRYSESPLAVTVSRTYTDEDSAAIGTFTIEATPLLAILTAEVARLKASLASLGVSVET